jgi:hypothetical protein
MRRLKIVVLLFSFLALFAGCSRTESGQPQQIENLKQQLLDKNSIEKIKAILEIEKIKNKQILVQLIPVLINALDDTTTIKIPVKINENPRGKEAVWVTYRVSTPANEAVVVLKNITGQNFGGEKSKWQDWWEKNKERVGGKDEK